MPIYELIHRKNAQDAANTAAETLLDLVSACGDKPFLLALSGGRSAQLFFAAIIDQARKRQVSFDNTEYFWADERSVPPQSPESNFKLAWDSFLAALGTTQRKIHRIRGELAGEQAALEAEAEIRAVAPLNDAGQPVLDCIFLGMGEDGHVASLFPNEPEELLNSSRVYRAVIAPKPPPSRVTLGYPAISSAKEVLVLATGPAKKGALQLSLDHADRTPLGRVIRLRTKTTIVTAP
jgi:6-phosphogluconolactonase